MKDKLLDYQGYHSLCREYRNPQKDYRLLPCAALGWAVSALILSFPRYTVIILGTLIVCAIAILIYGRDRIKTSGIISSVNDYICGKFPHDRHTSLRYTFLAALIIASAAGWNSYYHQLDDCTEEFMKIPGPVTISGYLNDDPISTRHEHHYIVPFHAHILGIAANKHIKLPAKIDSRQIDSRKIDIAIAFSDTTITLPQRGSHIVLTVKPYKNSQGLVQLISIDKILAPPAPYMDYANIIRDKFHAAAHRIGGDTEQLLSAFVIGDQRFITYSVKQDFVDSGLIHLMVFSGANFSIIIAFFLSGFTALRVPKKICVAIGILIIIMIVVIVGQQPSVLRAAIMSVITICTLLSARSRAPVGVLCAAVIVLLFIYPNFAIDLGYSRNNNYGHRWFDAYITEHRTDPRSSADKK